MSNSKLITTICKEIMLEKRKKGNILWYEGDSGKKCYIIIEGEVEFLKVHKNDKLIESKEIKHTKEIKEIKKIKEIKNIKNIKRGEELVEFDD